MKNMSIEPKKKIFSGVATAVVTPFCDEGIDYMALERIIEMQIEGGVDALVFCGTTGESVTLSEEEKKQLFSFSVKAVASRVPVIIGCASNCHTTTMRLSSAAIDAGADALLCVSPYYNKGTPRGIAVCYREISSLGAPVIIYNVPSRTGVDISFDILKQLANEENLCAVKECAGVCRIGAECVEFSDSYSIYCGNDAEMLPSFSVGAAGAISVISNVYPKLVKQMYDSYKNGDVVKAQSIYCRLSRMTSLLFEATSPAPVKYAMCRMGLCENSLRLPLSVIEESLCKKIDAEMKKIEQNI